MIATGDHAKVDKTTLRCCVRNQFIVDGAVGLGDQHYTAEFPQRSLGLAKRWVEQTLVKHGYQQRADSGVVWEGDIRVGTYVDSSFTDDSWGHICSAEWEESRGGTYRDARMNRDGEIEWDEYTL